MGKTTDISWCDSTWNPWRGCDKVSPGCKNCYIIRTPPFRTTGQKHGDPRALSSEAVFNAPLAWNKRPYVCESCGCCNDEHLTRAGLVYCDSCDLNRYWHRRRVFALSLGDWLDPEVPVEWLARMLDIIRQCPDLDFLLLSKRLELWHSQLDAAFLHAWTDEDRTGQAGLGINLSDWIADWIKQASIPKNVWIGTSVEDQQRADERIPELLNIPARVRFLSCEPLLEPLDLQMALEEFQPLNPDLSRKPAPVNWIIVGGESGPKVRPMDVSWLESIAGQCSAAKTPLFVKQDSGPKSGTQGRIPDVLWNTKHFPTTTP